jgi:membrane-associated phospholipid phosphatase
MPSLHLCWASWVCCSLWAATAARAAHWSPLRRWALRALLVAYPVCTGIVVMATGNHYILDAVAGATLTILAYLIIPRLMALRTRAATV